jgi:hypothetical protein
MEPAIARCRRLATVLLRILRGKPSIGEPIEGGELVSCAKARSTTCPTGFSGSPASCTVTVIAIVAAESPRHRRP